jgi:hypothetical protein
VGPAGGYVEDRQLAQVTERGSRASALTTALMTKLGRAGLAGLAAGAAKKATSVPKTATGALSTSATAKDGNRRANNSANTKARQDRACRACCRSGQEGHQRAKDGNTGPLASRRPRSTTHQGYTYTYKRLHLAMSDMLGVGRALVKEGINRRGHGHDGGYGDLQGGPNK